MLGLAANWTVDRLGPQGTLLVYAGAVAVGLWLLRQSRRSFWLVFILALPGTLAHELCHWLLGKLLNGQPVHFTVLPRREGRSYVLGAVTFANLRWYNAFFVGMAPLLLLPLAYGLFWWRIASNPVLGWPEALVAFLLANLIFGSFPSYQDVRIAARSPLGWLLLAGGLGWVVWRLTRPTQVAPVSALAGPLARLGPHTR